MTPANIVGMAALKELDIIAVTDHGSCKNCPAVLAMAKEYGITALPGMELTTAEEVHVVCLFSDLKDAMAFDDYVYNKLIPFPNNARIFGNQLIYDVNDRIIGTVPNLLINATTISFDDVYALTADFGGIMIPAHIDKAANSLLSILGFIPPDSRFSCVEIHDMSKYPAISAANPHLKHCYILNNSDAHYLEHINEAVHTISAPSRNPKDILRALTQHHF